MKSIDLSRVAYVHRYNAASLLIAKANRLADSVSGTGELEPAQRKSLAAAIAYFDLVLLLLKPYDPNYPTVINWKCNALVRLQQYEDAVAWYREIQRLSDETDGKAGRNATAKLAEEMMAKYAGMKTVSLPDDGGPASSFDDPPYCRYAEEFCALLAERKFKKAHPCLAPSLQAKVTVGKLKEDWLSLVGDAQPDSLSVVLQQHMVEWPSREADEIGWCYLSVSGENLSEGISMVVARTPYNGHWITQIEFGRP